LSTIVKEFANLNEFIKSVDDLIGEYRRRLGEMLRRLEELRVKSEQEKKLRSVLGKLGLPETASASNEVALRNIRILINPSPSQELASLESAVEALNNKITLLTAVRKELEVLGGLDIGVKIAVIYVDDVPRTVLLKLS
jgi:regulator of replication initiation timing